MTLTKEKKLDVLNWDEDWEGLVDRIKIFPTREENEAYLKNFIRTRGRA